MRPSLRPLLRLAVPLGVLALALPLAGCDEDVLDFNGDHAVQVTGDVLADFTGEAFYSTFDGPDGPTFVLLFVRDDLTDNDEEAYAYVALWRSGTRPGVGVYAVDNTDTAPTAFSASYADLIDAETAAAAGPVLTATTGVLTITDADPGELSGSFRFDGQGLFLPDTDTFIGAAVSGTFEARFIQPGVINGLAIDFDFE